MLLVFFSGLLIIPLVTQISINNGFSGDYNDLIVNVPVDKKGPVIADVAHYPAAPDNSQPVIVNCTITDATGIDIALLQYREQGGTAYTNITLTKVGVTDVYEASIGPFKASTIIEYRIYAMDNSTNQNFSIEDDGGSNYIFSVEDVLAPIISAVSNTPSEPSEVDYVKFNCDVTDESGVLSVVLSYRRNSGSWITKNMTKTSSKTYAYTTTTYFACDDLVEYKINATDNSTNHNFRVADNGGDYYDFTVVRFDDTGPTITNITVNPEIPVHGIKINITCTVTDDYSDVGEVKLHYRVNNGSWVTVSFNHTTGDNYLASIGPFNISDIIDFYITATDAYHTPNDAINDNDGDYYTFTVEKNTDLASFYMIIPIISIGVLALFRRKK